MGVSSTAHTVIGILVNRSDFYEEQVSRIGNSCCQKVETPFCGTCGSQVVTTETVPRFEMEEDVPFGDTYFNTVFGLPIVKVDPCYGDDEWIISVFQNSVYADCSVASFQTVPRNMKRLEQKLKDTLSPHGLWDEAKFGIYTVLSYC